MIAIRTCSVAELFDDPRCARLIAAYAEECGNALVGKPAPRRDMYENLERTGLAQCFAAYEDEALCGFALLVTAVVPHYGLSCATLESLFVERGAGSGRDLMRAVEELARERGCVAIFYAAPVESRLAELLFLRSSDLCDHRRRRRLRSDAYMLTNYVFCRRLN